MNKPPIEGILTPHMVPLDESGAVDEAELRRYVDWLIERGVHGLYPNGSTGEFTRFTSAERRRIVQIVCEQTAGRVMVLAGAAEANVTETLDTCQAYAEYGARAVAIVSPYYYRLGPEAVFAFFSEIARQTPIDVTLYNIPMFASPIDVDTVRRLADFERIVGIKDSSGDLSHMMRMIAAVRPQRPDFSFLCGWEATLLYMLLAGCNGGTHATAGVIPEAMVKLYNLALAGRIDEATTLQYDLLTLFDAMVDFGDFPEGFRTAVKLRGIRLGAGRQPLTDAQKSNILAFEQQLPSLLNKFELIP